MTQSEKTRMAPPIQLNCPTDDKGKEVCDFYYESVSARETDGDWLAQFCKQCRHLKFIDKKKLVHGQDS